MSLALYVDKFAFITDTTNNYTSETTNICIFFTNVLYL